MAIQLDAGLAVQLGSVLEDLTQLLARRMQMERQVPRYLEPPFGFNIPATASSLTVFDLGGPLQGRIWQVDRCAGDVAFLGSTRPAAGFTIYLFSGPPQLQGSTVLNPGIFTTGVNIEDAFTTYPFRATYSSRQFVVQNPEHLLIGVLQPSAGAAAHQIAGQVAITDLVIHEGALYVDPGF